MLKACGSESWVSQLLLLLDPVVWTEAYLKRFGFFLNF